MLSRSVPCRAMRCHAVPSDHLPGGVTEPSKTLEFYEIDDGYNIDGCVV